MGTTAEEKKATRASQRQHPLTFKSGRHRSAAGPSTARIGRELSACRKVLDSPLQMGV